MTDPTWDQITQILDLDPTLTGPVLLYGPPGTGKSYVAQARSTYITTLTDETPAAELRGHFLPKGSEFIWHDGPLVRAWREGQRLCINELHKASGDVFDLCHVAADHPATATLTLPTNETVRPASGYGLIATMNGDPDILDEALLDRFAFKIHVSDIHPDAVSSLPSDLRDVARATAQRPGRQRLSLRAWNVFAAVRDHIDPALAAAVVLGDSDFASTAIVKDVATQFGETCRSCGVGLVGANWHIDHGGGTLTTNCRCGFTETEDLAVRTCCGHRDFTYVREQTTGTGHNAVVGQCDHCGAAHYVAREVVTHDAS